MGRPRKQRAQKMAKTSFNLPETLKDNFKIAAIREHRDMSEILAELIEAYLAQKAGKTPRRDRANG